MLYLCFIIMYILILYILLNVLFFIKGADEFLGIVRTTPIVQLPPVRSPIRLAWYEIKRYGKVAGEVLVAFELFLVSC